MIRAPGDFEEFVTARWPELYAVATVTTGDPRSAARVVASALATLGRRWGGSAASGAPTADARTAVLAAALSAAGRDPAPPPRGATDNDAPGDDESRTRAALTSVLAAAPATARAALAVQHWWDGSPALVAAGARADPAEVRAEVAALDACLATAHAAALGRTEGEVGWALPAAVADTLEHVVDSAPVTDPVGLVDAERARGTRRRHRTALAGAGVAVAVVAVVAATASARPDPGGDRPVGLARDDPAWSSVTTWGPRGSLVDDPAVRTITADARRADPRGRLLYAGPVGDTLTVVMTDSTGADPALPQDVPGPALGEGFDRQVFLRLWTAPARLGAGALTATGIAGDSTARTLGLVALAVDQDTGGLPPVVLVLARPTVTGASVVAGSRPQPDGSLLPLVDDLPLVDGVATFPAGSTGFPPQIVVPGYEGPPAGTVPAAVPLPPTGSAAGLADVQRTLLSVVTEHLPEDIETTSVMESGVPPSAVDPDYVGSYPDFVGTHPEPLQVTVVTATTPDGGRVRTSRLTGSGPDAPSTFLERLAAVPSTDPHALVPLPVGDRAGFVAVAPDGATAQLLTLDGRLRDSATIHEGLATLASAEDAPGASFRLRVLAPDGHIVYDDVPPVPVELADAGGQD